MNRLEMVWQACPGEVIALVAASVALSALLAVLMLALFAPPETDEFVIVEDEV